MSEGHGSRARGLASERTPRAGGKGYGDVSESETVPSKSVWPKLDAMLTRTAALLASMRERGVFRD
jgi:hypothetical protein